MQHTASASAGRIRCKEGWNCFTTFPMPIKPLKVSPQLSSGASQGSRPGAKTKPTPRNPRPANAQWFPCHKQLDKLLRPIDLNR